MITLTNREFHLKYLNIILKPIVNNYIYNTYIIIITTGWCYEIVKYIR